MKKNEQKQGNIVVFIFTLVSLGFQTILTFVLLKKSTMDGVLSKIITILFLVFLSVFILVSLLSLSRQKYSKTAVGLYKNSMKVVKYVLKIILITISILNIIQASRLDLVALISSIFSLMLVILTIAFNVFVEGVKFKFKMFVNRRKIAKEQRLKERAEEPEKLAWLKDFRDRKNAEAEPKKLDLFATEEQNPFPDIKEEPKPDNGGTNGNGYVE